MVSKLYKLRDKGNYTLTLPQEKVYDPATGSYSDPPGESASFEVQLRASGGGRDGTERPGLETSQQLLEGRIVKTAGSAPLTFPEGVKAGETFDLMLLGRKGKLTLLPTPDEQHPKVRAKLGQKFSAVFEAVG